MQMVNIFNDLTIPTYFFKRCDISEDLYIYLSDKLLNENNNILSWELKNALIQMENIFNEQI
jgi:hypothetical protein